MEKIRYSLREINLLVKETIEDYIDSAYWVEVEISDISLRRGHCYMDLIEKEEHSNTPIARARATCWANVWAFVSVNFMEVTGNTLRNGIKVLLCVRPTFHEAFGFAWNIIDIDPTYTLGDMQRRKEYIIKTLKDSGIYELQKELYLSAFAKNIAVISAEEAAGYEDFCNQLHHNTFNFSFKTELFPAVMQGEMIERSVIAALNSIYQRQDEFDCVVIIRGGGATSDLSGFDTLPLAENVCNFPLPIITGIGHERDNSILDLISFYRVKTPTAAAVLLIENLANTLERITTAKDSIERFATQRLYILNTQLTNISAKIPMLFSIVKTKQETQYERYLSRMKAAVTRQIDAEYHKIEILNNRARSLNPDTLLSRGYSITTLNGKVLTSSSQIKHGDIIETRLKEGNIKSEIL